MPFLKHVWRVCRPACVPSCRPATWWCVLALCSTASASAQVTAGIDLAFASRYEWRGLARYDARVMQPDLYVAIGDGTPYLTLGAWSTLELYGEADVGVPESAFGEVNLWGELATSWRSVRVAAGGTLYRFRQERVTATEPAVVDMGEVYARIELTATPTLVPRLAIWIDPSTTRGAYLEGSVRLRLPLWAKITVPIGSVFLTGTAGYSLGQERNPADPTEPFLYDERGVTHVDLGVSTTVGYVPILFWNTAFHVEIHVPWAVDDLARIAHATPGNRADQVRPWVGVTISLSVPRCYQHREICG